MDEFYELVGALFKRWSMLDKEERRKSLSLRMPTIRIRVGRVLSLFRLLDNRLTNALRMEPTRPGEGGCAPTA